MKTNSFTQYLAENGGSERFEFWVEKEGETIRDHRGNFIPDIDRAYKFGIQLREQNPSVDVNISNNIVRVKLVEEEIFVKA